MGISVIGMRVKRSLPEHMNVEARVARQSRKWVQKVYNVTKSRAEHMPLVQLDQVANCKDDSARRLLLGKSVKFADEGSPAYPDERKRTA